MLLVNYLSASEGRERCCTRAAALATTACVHNAHLSRFYTFKCARFAGKKGALVSGFIYLATQQNKECEIKFLEGRTQEKLHVYFIIYDQTGRFEATTVKTKE